MRADLATLIHDPARIEALHRLRLLEPDADGAFARIGRLAAAALGVPAAGVNFVDAERQFPPGAPGGEEPSRYGFCPVVLGLGEPLFVADAREDPRFAADPVIRKLGVLAYAGVPLYSAGQPVGTLSAVALRPVRWTAEQRAVLTDLASLATDQIELRAQVLERREAEQRAERAQAEAQQQAGLLQAVLRQLPQGLLVVRAPDGEVTAANDEFRLLHGAEMLPAATLEEFHRYPVLRPDGTPYPPREGPLGRALLHGETTPAEELRYRRADGELIDLWVRAAPVRDDAGRIVAAVGIFTDITERKRLEQRQRALQRRFEFLSEASGLLSSSLEPPVVIEGLSRLGVERLADWCAIVEPDQQGRRLSRVAAAHRDPARAGEVRRWLDQPAIDLYSGSVLGTAFLERRTVRLIDPTPVQVAGRYANLAGYPELLAVLGHHSVVAVPLVAAGRKVGAMVFLRGPDRPPFDDDEVALAVELAARAAVALAHARRYEQEHGTAAFLQRSLLPQLATSGPLEVADAYLPGTASLTVGGDFYDVLDLGAGRAGLMVGDVMGHGVAAAAAMGQVRAALRAYARIGMPPAEALSVLDGLVAELPDGLLVTCLYGVYDVPAGELRVASAGHLPPLLRLPAGEVVPLVVPPGPPLGAGHRAFAETRHPVPPGAVLALFSDGLVEDRGRDLDTGLLALSVALSRFAAGSLAGAGTAVLRALGRANGSEDDVALLLVRSRETG